MKYLAVARGCNEPDNNTPSDEILCKIVDCEPSEVSRYESIIENDLIEDYVDVEVRLVAFGELDDWAEVATIW